MNFYEYLKKEIPNFIEVVTEEELINLKNFYDDYMTKLEIETAVFKKGLNNNSIIDYQNDFEKASQRRVDAKHNLDYEINLVKQRLNINNENKINK